jgi:hypothetical protein
MEFLREIYSCKCRGECKSIQKEQQSKQAIPGVTKYLAALRHAQGAD